MKGRRHRMDGPTERVEQTMRPTCETTMTRSIIWLLWVFIVIGCDRDDAVDDTLPDRKPEVTYQGKRLRDWVQQLESDNVHDRRVAAKALEEMGPRALDALPILEKVLGTSKEDNIVRFVAAVSIWQMTGQTQRVMPPLLSMLASEDVETQYRAVLALEIIGPPASAALPVLKNILHKYQSLDESRLGYDEHSLLATTREALVKIAGRSESQP